MDDSYIVKGIATGVISYVNPENKVAEVEALGDIYSNNGSNQCCTNKIRIIREITCQAL